MAYSWTKETGFLILVEVAVGEIRLTTQGGDLQRTFSAHSVSTHTLFSESLTWLYLCPQHTFPQSYSGPPPLPTLLGSPRPRILECYLPW